jgi:hypothetical protein
VLVIAVFESLGMREQGVCSKTSSLEIDWLCASLLRETQPEVVTLLQTQASVWLLHPFAILHPEPTHHFTAFSCGPLSLLRQAHTLVKRVKRLAALLHWFVPRCQSIHWSYFTLLRPTRP